jgi:hypothetical protein
MNPDLLKRRWYSRTIWEPITIGLLVLGLLMLMQPFSMWLFSRSFAVILSGALGFTVASKLPD